MSRRYSLAQPQSHAFFLSHHHSDHTVGLYRGWDVGFIYTSPITATLLVQQDGLSPSVIRAIPLHQRVFVEGAYVTLIDANHCPGAVIFVFELPPFVDEAELLRPGPRLTGHGPVYVHCGDCRYCREMGDLFTGRGSGEVEAAAGQSTVEVPSAYNHYASLYAASSLVHLSRLSITGVYLDTTSPHSSPVALGTLSIATSPLSFHSSHASLCCLFRYCRPVHTFPPQADIVRYTLGVVREILEKERKSAVRLATKSSAAALSSSALAAAWCALSSSLSPLPPVCASPAATPFLDGYARAQTQRTLFLVGSYSIGKEKVFLEIARQYGMKIYVSRHEGTVSPH